MLKGQEVNDHLFKMAVEASDRWAGLARAFGADQSQSFTVHGALGAKNQALTTYAEVCLDGDLETAEALVMNYRIAQAELAAVNA